MEPSIARKKGFLLVNLLSKKTYRYGRGEKVEEDTFIDQENSEKGVFTISLTKRK